MGKFTRCMMVAGSIFLMQASVAVGEKVVVVPLTGSIPAQLQPIAQGHFSSSCTDMYSYGVTGCVHDSTGNWTLTLTKSYTDYPTILATSMNSSAAAEIATTSSDSNTGNTISIHIANGTGAATDSNFNFVVYADTQSASAAGSAQTANSVTESEEGTGHH